MEILIWAGSAVTLGGVALLVLCIAKVATARRSAGSEDEMRARMQKALALNLGALCISALGLMMVVVGVFLR